MYKCFNNYFDKKSNLIMLKYLFNKNICVIFNCICLSQCTEDQTTRRLRKAYIHTVWNEIVNGVNAGHRVMLHRSQSLFFSMGFYL